MELFDAFRGVKVTLKKLDRGLDVCVLGVERHSNHESKRQ